VSDPPRDEATTVDPTPVPLTERRRSDPEIAREAAARQQELQKEYLLDVRRAAMIAKVGAVMWPFCVIFDYLQAYRLGEGDFVALVSLRAICEVGIVLAALRLSQTPPPTEREFTRMATATMALFAATLAGMCVASSGFDSIYIAGNLLVAVGLVFIPQPFWPSLGRVALVMLPHPVILFISTLFDPRLAAQLHDPQVMAVALQYLVCCIAVGPGVAAFSASYAQVRKDLFESKSIGRYRLRRQLGRGGMSEIWAAYHMGLRREVALKILESRLHLDETFRRRFEQEVQAMAGLTHPNTVRVFDFGTTDDGLLFYAMELLEGENLGQFVKRRGALPVARALHLVRQAAGALAEAHAKGIVHRDVKPENLYVTTAGGEPDFVKVLDFGIAVFEHDPEEEPAAEIAGSPATISPEVLRGEPATPASDVYALGVVLYFLLTGQYTFGSLRGPDILAAHLEEVPVPPSVRRGEALPPELEGLILRCLSKDPGDRPRDAMAFAARLDALRERHRWNPREDASVEDASAVRLSSRPPSGDRLTTTARPGLART